ncbi:unnamed protein product [Allacma fusca]|uniref:Uncharacterized protein n=1 Tax=Allacma fusca TaxID=39272 RepID=A0A8J2LUJ8_9HEXA|nr:unnamed protein product [Allacma fusca]
MRQKIPLSVIFWREALKGWGKKMAYLWYLKMRASIILTFATLLLSCHGLGTSSGGFGDKCDENDFDSCDIGAALSCISSTCNCLYPWMIYDPLRSKCLSTVSQPCDLDADVKFVDCVTNAYCVSLPNEFGQPFPQCVCNRSYTPKAKKNCSDKKEQVSFYGQQLSQICCPR